MLTINVDGIEDNFKPAIKNSIKYLESAQSILSSIKIPADFYYSSRIKTLSQDLLNIDDRVIEIKKWVEEKIVSLNNLESNNKNLFNDIWSSFGLLGINTFDGSDIVDSLTSGKNAFESFSEIGSMLFTEVKYDLTSAVGTTTDYLKMLGEEIIESELGEYILVPIYENVLLPAYENIVVPVANEIVKTGATVVVGGTSILSGFLNFFEGAFKNEADSNELSSKVNNWLYEDTSIGRAINDKSYLKYDSETAISIQGGVETGCAAVSNFFVSLGEGIVSFGESLVDALAIAGTAVMTPFVTIGGGMLGFLGGGIEGAVESWNNGEFKKFATGCKEIGTSVVNIFHEFNESGLEGVIKSGELKDIVTGCKTVGSSVISIGADIFGTGFERGIELAADATTTLWSTTQGAVATDCAALLFKQEEGDYLFDTLGEDVYNTTRSIGKGVGKVVSIVVVTIATFGVGGVAAAGGEITATAAVSATTATNFATVAAVSGFGEGTQNAWADGASIAEGLAFGFGNAAWEGFQWFIGGKIGGLNVFKGSGSKIFNAGLRVVLDTIDGGVESFVQPGLSAIYKDGYYDDNGNYVEFSKDASIADRYKELFDDNGGWQSVITNTIVSGGMSMFGELFDLGRFMRDSNNKAEIDVDSNIASNEKYIFKVDDSLPDDYKAFVNDITDSFSMSKSLGEELESILDTDEYIIGIHKAGEANPDSILQNGLWLTGDTTSGRVSIPGQPELSDNIIFIDSSGAKDVDFINFCKNIEGASGYKNSLNEGSAIIVKIPKKDFDNIGKITYYDGANNVLKNDYILGYVTTSTDSTGNVVFKDIIYQDANVRVTNNIDNNSSIFDMVEDSAYSAKKGKGQYVLSIDKVNAYVNKLELDGYSPNAIVSQLQAISQTGDIKLQREIADYSFAYLYSKGFKDIDAANIMLTINQNVINSRGMYTAYSSGSTSYNIINQFNDTNQVYNVNNVIQMFDTLPKGLKDSVNSVNIYDCYNPADYYWQVKYGNSGDGYFVSAATGGGGVINIWAGSNSDSMWTIAHEAGHNYYEKMNANMIEEFKKACEADYKLTGRSAMTEYGKHNISEDFAETVAAYVDYLKGGKETQLYGYNSITSFPNRKAWLEKYLK